MNTVEKMREVLANTLSFARIRWGNLDEDANKCFLMAEECFAAIADPTESEMESRAKFRTPELEKRADELHLAVILYSRRPSRTYLAAIDAAILQKIGRAVNVLAVKQCNTGLTDADEKRWEKLDKQANEVASWYGLTATAHGDPRGYVLRLHGEGLEKNGWGDGFGVV